MTNPRDDPANPRDVVDVVVVGAGLGGLYQAHKLRENGFSIRAFEAGTDVGGTWYWNRYPGARCDVESVHYSYFFDDALVAGWTWSEKFAAQPEILRYINWVADTLDLRQLFTFETRVERAVFNEQDSIWTVTTSTGDVVRSHFVVFAVGALSAASTPDFPGLDNFAGSLLRTGSWPHEQVDFTGKRVGVIGTGSSGIQVIPFLAKLAAELRVFQRTPNYTLPARNRPLYQDEIIDSKRRSAEIREMILTTPTAMPRVLGHQRSGEVSDERRREMFEVEWKRGGVGLLALFSDTTRDLEANEHTAEFVREKIAVIVEDPATAEKLTPRTYPIGGKRIVLDTDYFATYNLSHVSLVDLREESIVRFTEEGIQTDLAEYPLDVVVFATGFDAMTGPLTRIDIRGRAGQSLADEWSNGPRNYLGLTVSGFPNMFMITGPGSPSVLVNMARAVEQHVEWISDCLVELRERGIDEIDAAPDAQNEWVDEVNGVAEQTLFVRANSWYLGSNIEGKPRVFLPYAGGMLAYRAACDVVARDGYRTFKLRNRVST